MQHFQIAASDQPFQVLASSSHSQAATMALAPGEKREGPKPKDGEYDQWVFVLSGKGQVKAGLKEVLLKDSTLVLIEKGEPHEIVNIGAETLRTINFYTPPAH